MEQSPTIIQFDLAQVLTKDELAKFIEAAKQAKAESLTAHFLSITILPELKPAA